MKESGQQGRQAEDVAAHFLRQRGLCILKRNFHCRCGEVDLIAREGETLVFVEVRLRRSGFSGGPAESIDPYKQRRLVMAARFYLMRLTPVPACRFDALLLMGSDEGLQWLKNIILL